jgi:DNA polymerase-4
MVAPPAIRRILHLDMDAFYASVEQRDDASLRGRPVAVGAAKEQRGVICAASYEARAFGVRSAMSTAKALRQCPDLILVPPNFARYRAISESIFALYRAVTPLVEPLSLDEAYLDVTENAWGETLGMTVAKRLKAEVRETVGLTVSAGVAPNKFLAKIASGWQKPDGLTVIAPERVEGFLQQLPIDALWGVGPVTARKLRGAGLKRLTDVRTADPQALRQLVGSLSDWLKQLAQGVDDRAVEPHRAAKSCSSENTFSDDLIDGDRIRAEVRRMGERVGAWLVRRALYAKTVTLKVRYNDFSTVTRSLSATPATQDATVIADRAVALLDRTDAGRRPIRLLGVGVHGLCETPTPVAGDADEEDAGRPVGRLPF